MIPTIEATPTSVGALGRGLTHSLDYTEEQAMADPIQNRTCSIEGCDRKLYARKMCSRHYQRWLYAGKPPGFNLKTEELSATCSIEGCQKHRRSKGMCENHYARWRRAGRPDGTDWLKRRTVKTCEFPGCDRAACSRGLCDSHRAQRAKGRPLTPIVQQTAEERFWSKVDFTGFCWLWTASGVDGYGRFHLEGAQVMAHRLAYEWLVGPIPDGLQPDHLCRVRKCVNPDHLELVTQHENMLRGYAPAAINARKTFCERCGGPLQTTSSGKRQCLPCKRRDRT